MTQSQKLSDSEEICRLVAEQVKTEYLHSKSNDNAR